MNVFLAVAAGLLLIIGFIGTFVPVLPGAPLAWCGLLVAYFSDYCNISLTALIIFGVVAVIITVLDNILPVIMTKKFGGSKAATTGSTIGLIIGFFLGPVGIILGPFAGALLGELIHTRGQPEGSFKAALGAFAGFLTGTGLKMLCVLFFIWYYVRGLIR